MKLKRLYLRIILTLSLIFLFLSFPDFNFGQETVVKGMVKDKDGKPLKDVKVTFSDLSTGMKFTLKSDKAGKFIKVGIPPAVYKITVECAGYFTFQSQLMARFAMEENVVITLEKIPPRIEEDKDLAEGIELFKQEKYREAIEAFKRASSKFPSNVEVLYDLGLSYLRSEDADKAIVSFEKALILKPDMIEAHFALGECYFKKGMNEKAMEAFSQALQHQPNNAKAYYNLGIIYYKYEKLNEALASFEKSLELEPKFSSAYYQAALANIKIGNFKKAMELFDEFLKLEPNASEASQVKMMIEELKKKIGWSSRPEQINF